MQLRTAIDHPLGHSTSKIVDVPYFEIAIASTLKKDQEINYPISCGVGILPKLCKLASMVVTPQSTTTTKNL
jgi:hypothetical protein